MLTRWTTVGTVAVLMGLLTAAPTWADGPGDNLPDKVRRIPPPGVKIPDADRAELEAGVKKLGEEIAALRDKLEKEQNRELEILVPDVEIFHKAVDWALRFDEFYDVKEVATAKALLKQGFERAAALREGKHPWTTQTGLVARGYRSRLDDSVQPYGIFVPEAAMKPENKGREFRCDFWCHGRGEKLTELAFINGVQKNGTEFKPTDHFLVQLYGRYCCANKFAGEVDYRDVRLWLVLHRYPIDRLQQVMRGFSMGGAACWQFAVHYPDDFAAAAPGAGFCESADFLKVFQNEPSKPTWWEAKLWRWYDCPPLVENLRSLPTVAYSGEIDKQKQAADLMVAAAKAAGFEIPHIIGPKTAHKYEPAAKKAVIAWVNEAVEKRTANAARRVVLVTPTLRYNRNRWITITAMTQHWEYARVDADWREDDVLEVKTSGVVAMELDHPKFREKKDFRFLIDGKPFNLDTNWRNTFTKSEGVWLCQPGWNRNRPGFGLGLVSRGPTPSLSKVDPAFAKLRKKPELQGPIDDAFLSSFLIVTPTGKPLNDVVGAFAQREADHAINHWRRQFRGEPRVKAADAVTDADLKHNLILFGDPSSNPIIARIADKLPIKWTADGVAVGDKSFSADKHMPVLVYPNPYNAERYVVLNSGFTFREYDYLNNARQTPKLPDWAVVDASTPMTSRGPGKIVAADFFDESWKAKQPMTPVDAPAEIPALPPGLPAPAAVPAKAAQK